MYTHLTNALKEHYRRKGNKIVFRNNSSLNQLALQMWERLDYSEMDSSVLSKVINGQRLFTFKQLRVFCDIMNFSHKQRNMLFDALTNDKMMNEGLDYKKENKFLYRAKLNNQANTTNSKRKSMILLDNRSRILLKKIFSEIIPKTNELSKIGIKFSNKSYYLLVNKGIQKYRPFVENKSSDFDVSIPYCGFKKTVEGLENNCKCGYHLALYGVIKECIVQKIFSKDAIQAELKKWVSFFFPMESVIYYLENLSSRDNTTTILLHNLKRNSRLLQGYN